MTLHGTGDCGARSAERGGGGAGSTHRRHRVRGRLHGVGRGGGGWPGACTRPRATAPGTPLLFFEESLIHENPLVERLRSSHI
jgi:hypothetical protein